MGFPCGSASKESVCNTGDLGSILGLGRSPGEGKGYPSPVFSRIPTPVFWPGEFHGLYSPWARKEVGHDRVTFTSLGLLLYPALTFILGTMPF